jgi:hypothetical protein
MAGLFLFAEEWGGRGLAGRYFCKGPGNPFSSVRADLLRADSETIATTVVRVGHFTVAQHLSVVLLEIENLLLEEVDIEMIQDSSHTPFSFLSKHLKTLDKTGTGTSHYSLLARPVR